MEHASRALAGFTLVEVLGASERATVYRAVRDGRAFALKIWRGERNESFRREAAALARLDHPALVRVVEVDEAEGVPYLVMELVEGKSLADALDGGPLPENDVVALARALAEGLIEIHRRGLVHRDLKPANIMLVGGGAAKIIDFGFAASVVDGPGGGGATDLMGTALYCPPEQSGLVKRPVDGRSDLYALGGVLYHAATGQPPYQATSAAELLRQHLTAPVPDPQVASRALGAIIVKLLAKDPDDRYQTARGLLHDLASLGELERAEPLVLGSADGARLTAVAETPFVGRRGERAQLAQAWRSTRDGRGGLAQVEGEPGSGKSRLLRELAAEARATGGLVLSGKAQEAERTPFAPLREALGEWLARVARLPAAERDEIHAAVRAAAGDMAGVISRLSRPLAAVLGDVAERRPLDPTAEQERFHDWLAELFIELARRIGPTLLVLDDVQWLDEGSAAIVRRLAERAEKAPLLVAGSARPGGALADARGLRLPLGPLEPADVVALVTAQLGGRPLDAAFIAQIAARASGNPFAVVEYTRALLDHGLLRPTAGGWVVDQARLHAVALPTDVVELLLGRIGRAGGDTRALLATAAVIGFEVPRDLLEAVAGRDASPLDGGEATGLVEPVTDGWRFVHDRVHEALLSAMTAGERRDTHQRVAEALEGNPDADVFALAHHHGAGHPERNPRRVFETCLAAGQRALADFASAMALELLERADAAAGGLTLSTAERGDLDQALGDACARRAQHARARQRYQACIDGGRGDVNLLEQHIARTYASEGQTRVAWERLSAVLARLGEPPLRGRLIPMLWLWLVTLLRVRTGIGFGGARHAERQRRDRVASVLADFTAVAYFMTSRTALFECTLRALHNGHFLGRSAATARAYGSYALAVSNFGWKPSTERYCRRAKAMAAQLDDRETSVYVDMLCGVATELSGDNIRGHEAVRRTLGPMMKVGTSWNIGAIIGHVAVTAFASGRSGELLEWAREHKETLDRTGAVRFQVNLYTGLYSQLALVGRHAEALRARAEMIELIERAPDRATARAYMHANEVLVLADREDFGPELEEHISGFLSQGPFGHYIRFGHAAVGYARLEQLVRARPGERAAALLAFRAVHDLIGKPRALCRNPYHRCHLLTLRAALARETGAPRRALPLLDEAERLAREVDSRWGVFAAARERARTERSLGHEAAARAAAQVALEIARREGWKARARQVRRELGLADDRPDSFRSQSTSSSAGLARDRRLELLARVSLASASSLEPGEQARAALDELVAGLGAERAALFVVRDGTLALEHGRTAEGQNLRQLTGYSATVVERARASREPVLVSGTDEGEALGSQSAVLHDLRSILAVPLALLDRLVGVLYLDSKVVKGLFADDDADLLRVIGQQLTTSLETARLARLEAAAKDLALTAAVQTYFLPERPAARGASCALHGGYRAASECSGDWWWYDLGPGRLRVVVGDMSGHGAPSAMLTAAAAALFRMVARDGTLPPERLLDMLDRELAQLAGGTYQLALTLVTLDEADRTLRWWSAGAPPILVLHADGNVTRGAPRSSALGSAEGAAIDRGELPLAAGDRVLLCTDGAFEWLMPSGRPFGVHRLSALLAETRGLPLAAALARIMSQIESMTDARLDGAPLPDDMTIVLVDAVG